MTQSSPKDKSRPRHEEPADDVTSDEEAFAELVEAVAAAYFGACRKVARLLNRKKS